MSDKFQTKLGEIRARFEAGLDEKLAAAAAALHRASSSRSTMAERIAALTELRLFAHDLAGISPSLGFAELGQRAGRLEESVLMTLRADTESLVATLPLITEAFLGVAAAMPSRQGHATADMAKETRR
jgi:HPt (histidine-containing phosphotransfer) domain-containing protein